MSHQPKQIYEFGPYRLDSAERLLLRDGEVVPLQPKIFDLLLVLVERHGHLLEKDELMKLVWPDTVVEEANLANNISILRRTLSQNGERFIETAPKRGYRFVADVKESEARDYAVAASRRMESSAVVVEEARMRVTPTVKSFAGNLLSRAARHKAAMAILLVFIIGLVLFRPRVLNQVNSRPAAPFQKMESNAITRTGNAKDVAISPDGQYIAYVTDSDGLWLKNLVANN